MTAAYFAPPYFVPRFFARGYWGPRTAPAQEPTRPYLGRTWTGPRVQGSIHIELPGFQAIASAELAPPPLEAHVLAEFPPLDQSSFVGVVHGARRAEAVAKAISSHQFAKAHQDLRVLQDLRAARIDAAVRKARIDRAVADLKSQKAQGERATRINNTVRAVRIARAIASAKQKTPSKTD